MIKLFAANWKMHGGRAALAQWLDEFSPPPGCKTALLPPTPYLFAARQRLLEKSSPDRSNTGGDSESSGNASLESSAFSSATTSPGRLALGAQNISAHENDGAHTGEVSARMAADVGCEYALVGHSERRAAGENDDDCAKKIAAALRAGLSPILCIGETAAEDAAGRAQDAIEKQLQALKNQPESIASIAVAYEPVWAIGSGKTPSAERLQKTREEIRRRLLALSADGGDIPILYGGSIAPDNAALLAEAGMDGGLVGGASLSAAAFMRVCEVGGGGAIVVK